MAAKIGETVPCATVLVRQILATTATMIGAGTATEIVAGTEIGEAIAVVAGIRIDSETGTVTAKRKNTEIAIGTGTEIEIGTETGTEIEIGRRIGTKIGTRIATGITSTTIATAIVSTTRVTATTTPRFTMSETMVGTLTGWVRTSRVTRTAYSPAPTMLAGGSPMTPIVRTFIPARRMATTRPLVKRTSTSRPIATGSCGATKRATATGRDTSAPGRFTVVRNSLSHPAPENAATRKIRGVCFFEMSGCADYFVRHGRLPHTKRC